MTASVYISLGSNVDSEVNICNAILAIREAFGELRLSPVYQSAAVGFDGDDFLNLVVVFETAKSVQFIVTEIRQLEDDLGRDRSQPRYSPRPIDLDILLYDDLVLDQPGIRIPRQEIFHNAHVLKPLQDLIADSRHPVTGESYGKLWQEMVDQAPRLEIVELDLD